MAASATVQEQSKERKGRPKKKEEEEEREEKEHLVGINFQDNKNYVVPRQ